MPGAVPRDERIPGASEPGTGERREPKVPLVWVVDLASRRVVPRREGLLAEGPRSPLAGRTR